ncbi:MAG: NUDIX domain-containing protein [Niabella sp.]
MYTTIYINNKPVYLCDELDENLEKLHHRPDTIFIDELDTHTVKAMLREIALPEINCGIFLYKDLEQLKKQFFKKFELHIAGGGLVINEKKELLMIFRRGSWDLPKGHLDKGETIEECAIREVQEETGLQKISLFSPLTVTYHTYEQGTHHILKESHWYLMKFSGNEEPVPQSEEDIEKIEWVKKEAIAPYLHKAYPSIREVIQCYTDRN